jgi:NAD(P)-dependent dehydrogenase (short-subunit alcohol dehydrogenase family)
VSKRQSTQMFDLTGRVALVTGAGRGLGRVLALGLAGAGASIAGAGRSIDPLRTLVVEVGELGSTGTAHTVDVTDPDAVSDMVDEVIERHGRIDILVNNAGMKVPQKVLDVSEAAWDQVLGTNLKGAFFVAQAAGRHMVERGQGKIINVASTYAVVGADGRATYAASKGGLLQLTRVMAIEWASKGVNVNAVGPTSIPTPMNEALFADPAWRERALAKIPAGRFCAPEDVIGSVVFLASAASDMIHGQLLLIDGGLTAV